MPHEQQHKTQRADEDKVPGAAPRKRSSHLVDLSQKAKPLRASTNSPGFQRRQPLYSRTAIATVPP